MATTVSVRGLKNSLSRCLRLVRAGERVVITDRGHPIATISPVGCPHAIGHQTVAEHLSCLASRGLVHLPECARTRARVPRRLPRVNLSDAIDEDRGERC